MPRYMSHIYAKPKEELLSFLQSDPLLSTGLFYIRQSASDEVKSIIRDGLTNNGLVVVREVCDPLPNYQNEAEAHKSTNAPVLSWWKLQGSHDVQVIPPNHIPTLGFGTIYDNYETNPPPPLEFLRFLKHLSTTYKTIIAFYHHYTAFEDRLADCEYAWIFGKQDFVYIRHMDEPFKTVLYVVDVEPQIIHDKHTQDQPILHFVMQKFGLSLAEASARPYFSDFDWERFRFGARTLLTESTQPDMPPSPNLKTLTPGKRKQRRYPDKRRVQSQDLKVSGKSDLQEANRDLDLHGIIVSPGDRALDST